MPNSVARSPPLPIRPSSLATRMTWPSDPFGTTALTNAATRSRSRASALCRPSSAIVLRRLRFASVSEFTCVGKRSRAAEHPEPLAAIRQNVQHADRLSRTRLMAFILRDLGLHRHLAARQNQQAPSLGLA